MRRAWTGGAAVAAAAAVGAVVLSGPGGDPEGGTARAEGSGTATATVERTDLVDRETVSGKLGYADAAPLLAGVSGTLTRIRGEGDVLRRGDWLYEVDGEPTGWLFYGDRPAWRDLGPAATRGRDVRQLEAGLAALGHAPGTVDGEWTAATSAAVRRFQDDRGLAEDGVLELGTVVFRPGPVRMGEVRADPGRRVGPGMELGTVASARREVLVDLPADRQKLAKRGARVTVDLPDGRSTRGRIAGVGGVARDAGEGATPTVEVRIRLRGRAARRSGLDQAPVDVGFEAERARNALAVPVTALLAQPGGEYAVEVPCEDAERSGCPRLVPVEVGVHADGLVEVRGDLRPGDRVVVPS